MKNFRRTEKGRSFDSLSSLSNRPRQITPEVCGSFQGSRSTQINRGEPTLHVE